MKSKKNLLPIIILAAGVLAMVAVTCLVNVAKKPEITEKEFPFSITYKYGDETEIIESVLNCEFVGAQESIDPADRFYDAKIEGKDDEHGDKYLLFEDEKGQLFLCAHFNAGYLMGDPEYDDSYDSEYPYRPYLAYYDAEGIEYTDEETMQSLGAEIIGWDYPEPIENKLVFSHITRLTASNVLPLLAVAFVVLIICLIVVRKDKEYKYNVLDFIGILSNTVIGLVLLPIITIVGILADVNGDGAGLIYQIDRCVPAFCLLALTVSICLRKKGYRISSFIVQFAGPVAFVLSLILEGLLTFV